MPAEGALTPAGESLPSERGRPPWRMDWAAKGTGPGVLSSGAKGKVVAETVAGEFEVLDAGDGALAPDAGKLAAPSLASSVYAARPVEDRPGESDCAATCEVVAGDAAASLDTGIVVGTGALPGAAVGAAGLFDAVVTIAAALAPVAGTAAVAVSAIFTCMGEAAVSVVSRGAAGSGKAALSFAGDADSVSVSGAIAGTVKRDISTEDCCDCGAGEFADAGSAGA